MFSGMLVIVMQFSLRQNVKRNKFDNRFPKNYWFSGYHLTSLNQTNCHLKRSTIDLGNTKQTQQCTSLIYMHCDYDLHVVFSLGQFMNNLSPTFGLGGNSNMRSSSMVNAPVSQTQTVRTGV